MEGLLKQLQLKNRKIPIGGGDINQAYRVSDGKKDYFLKYHPNMSADFFQAEADGLAELGQAVRVPEVIQVGAYQKDAYLLLEWIEPGRGDQRDLGNALSRLHDVKSERFGYPRNNFMGLFPQINQQEKDWWTFYFTNRIEVQIEAAKKRNHWHTNRDMAYQSFKAQVLEKWAGLNFKPSLLHGDFWSGNTYFDQQGEPVFVDPAVYYGHRELDIAMSQLFGGFRKEFLTAYQEAQPLYQGWEERLPIYQLYYLLVHLNLFGESYGSSVDRILGGS
ncbi:aminoglycoside phosphotransferase [Enterococcus florum]|uniref:Aminoglycoside phosphotransferase n=1 Tax=Enterococcus florum TaxID=2480627 RepID=A0A4P5P6H1_9ENTE|nr:fructosamine kinase family protein [Enterococcus florum]GCF93350.1 aminoglycoside phosphotransferase [Enterococcus florum]